MGISDDRRACALETGPGRPVPGETLLAPVLHCAVTTHEAAT